MDKYTWQAQILKLLERIAVAIEDINPETADRRARQKRLQHFLKSMDSPSTTGNTNKG